MTDEMIQIIEENTRQLSVMIPVNLHNAFKAECAINGVTITKAIIDFIKNYVEKRVNKS